MMILTIKGRNIKIFVWDGLNHTQIEVNKIMGLFDLETLVTVDNKKTLHIFDYNTDLSEYHLKVGDGLVKTETGILQIDSKVLDFLQKNENNSRRI